MKLTIHRHSSQCQPFTGLTRGNVSNEWSTNQRIEGWQMDDYLTFWFLLFAWIISVPVSFLVCGPLFREYERRFAVIAWFWGIEAALIAVFYFTTPGHRLSILLVAGAMVLTSILGLLATHFRWHLGPRTRKIFESIAGFWIRVVDWILRMP